MTPDTIPPAYYVTEAEVEALLDSAEVSETVFFEKHLVVCYKLPNGWTLIGEGACIDPTRFSLQVGREVARERAKDQVWKLLGYQKQLALSSAI
jgi:hypothetical protein